MTSRDQLGRCWLGLGLVKVASAGRQDEVPGDRFTQSAAELSHCVRLETHPPGNGSKRKPPRR
jgi:hypothetical protein